MNHKFENGQGGIMDYGAGEYKGVVQFNVKNRVEVCSFLTYVLASRRCNYLRPMEPGSSCGDGVLSKEEECECLDGSNQCDKCHECKVTASNVECSAKDFVLRNDLMVDLVVVSHAGKPFFVSCEIMRCISCATMCIFLKR
jgi:hypothetical protein